MLIKSGYNSKIALQVEDFINAALEDANTIVKEFAKEISNEIIDRTPVDTGRAKANNQVAVGNVPRQSVNETDKNGEATKARNNAEIEKAELGDTITIFNNVTYGIPLECGHSKQAPNGFYVPVVDNAEAMLHGVIEGVKRKRGRK